MSISVNITKQVKVEKDPVKKDKKRRNNKKGVDASFTLEQWEYCKEHFNNRCAYCGKQKKLEQDHFIPLTNNGEYNINNIVPSCRSCNASKNNNDFFEWYKQQEFYSSTRENKILSYLKYYEGYQQMALTF